MPSELPGTLKDLFNLNMAMKGVSKAKEKRAASNYDAEEPVTGISMQTKTN